VSNDAISSIIHVVLRNRKVILVEEEQENNSLPWFNVLLASDGPSHQKARLKRYIAQSRGWQPFREEHNGNLDTGTTDKEIGMPQTPEGIFGGNIEFPPKDVRKKTASRRYWQSTGTMPKARKAHESVIFRCCPNSFESMDNTLSGFYIEVVQ
jgi:hypothetical protein